MYQLCEMVYFEIPFKDRRFRHAEPNPCTCTSTFPKSGVFAFDLLYLFFVFFWVLKMNKKGCELCPPARGFLQGLVHEADPGVSRAMKPDMDLGVFAAWLLFFSAR
ncbi:unnamed protein product [Effrenium voratum]|nr:unnamed protein product [Effrenium voratum]